jgi:hypothetical protein
MREINNFQANALLFGDGYEERERIDYHSTVVQNVIGDIKTLLRDVDSQEDEMFQIASTLILHCNASSEESLTPEIGKAISAVWGNPRIQAKYAHRGPLYGLNLQDSLEYWCANMDRLTKAQFIPNEMDVKVSRRTTLGVTQRSFKYEDGQDFVLVDVGGERTQRNKWSKPISDCDLSIYVIALSHFDQVLFEDVQYNALKETMDLWDFLTQNETLKTKPCVLFLNNVDKFMKNKEPFLELFPDFTGRMDPVWAIQFIKAWSYYSDMMKDKFLSFAQKQNVQVEVVIGNALSSKDIEMLVKKCFQITSGKSGE